MDKVLIKWPRLTTAQVILALVLFVAIWIGFLTVDIQYNRQVSIGNQQNLIDLVNDSLENQNRTKAVMPLFLNSIKDTHKVAELLPNLTKAINHVADTTKFLADNFGADSHYLDRENFQYHQANKSFAVANNTFPQLLQNQQEIKILLNMLNKTLNR